MSAYFPNKTQDKQFNPLDNDYIQVFTANWEPHLNKKEGKPWAYLTEGPGLELCSKTKVDKVFDDDEKQLLLNFMCFKDKEAA